MSVLKEIVDKCKQAFFIDEEDIQATIELDEHCFTVQFAAGERVVLSTYCAQ